MPQARTTGQRETIDVVAPWYSQQRESVDPANETVYPTLQQRKKIENGEETDEVE